MESKAELITKWIADAEAGMAELEAMDASAGYVLGFPQYAIYVKQDADMCTALPHATVFNVAPTWLVARNGKGEDAEIQTLAEARETALAASRDHIASLRALAD